MRGSRQKPRPKPPGPHSPQASSRVHTGTLECSSCPLNVAGSVAKEILVWGWGFCSALHYRLPALTTGTWRFQDATSQPRPYLNSSWPGAKAAPGRSLSPEQGWRQTFGSGLCLFQGGQSSCWLSCGAARPGPGRAGRMYRGLPLQPHLLRRPSSPGVRICVCFRMRVGRQRLGLI